MHSLIPRPSHCPVFDHLQYAKTEGENLVHFITWITSVSSKVDKGVSDWKNAFCAHGLCFEPVAFSLRGTFETSALGAETTRWVSSSFILWGTPPPLCLPRWTHWRYSCDKMDQAFPFCFCILKVVKTGCWEGLGKRLCWNLFCVSFPGLLPPIFILLFAFNMSIPDKIHNSTRWCGVCSGTLWLRETSILRS